MEKTAPSGIVPRGRGISFVERLQQPGVKVRCISMGFAPTRY